MFETSLDWKIGKKLIEAGGLGSRVYIHLPRNHGRTQLLRMYYEQLLNQGRQVIIMQPNRKPVGLQAVSYADIIVDHDILSPESYARAERIWKEYWKDHNPMKVKGEKDA